MSLNDGLAFKNWLVDLIKWSPSYKGLEYMMSSLDFRQYLREELFYKAGMAEQDYSPVQLLKVKSHFINAFWQRVTQKKLRFDNETGWKYTDNFLKNMDLEPLRETEDVEAVEYVIKNLFKLSITIKKRSI